MFLTPKCLLDILFARFAREIIHRPNLTVGVWIGATHHLTAILKHLHPVMRLAKRPNLLTPERDHSVKFVRSHH